MKELHKGITLNSEPPASCRLTKVDHVRHLKRTSGVYPYGEPQFHPNRSLLRALREGGYVLYARHGEATLGEDQPYLNFWDCSTQRNLSEVGKRQAINYGEILRRLRIPIYMPVLASPFCRTLETAQLAFGRNAVQVDPYWFQIYRLSAGLSVAEQQRILNSLRSILEIQPPPGGNKVIIAHSFPRGIGLGDISSMGTAIVKPRGPGNGYQVVGQVSLQEWMSLSS